VEQNVVFEFWFFLGSIEQKLGIRFISLDAQLGFDSARLIEPDEVDPVEIEILNDPVELLLRIVPEHDPGLFIVVDFTQGLVELFGVHQAFTSTLGLLPVIDFTSASRSPNLP